MANKINFFENTIKFKLVLVYVKEKCKRKKETQKKNDFKVPCSYAILKD